MGRGASIPSGHCSFLRSVQRVSTRYLKIDIECKELLDIINGILNIIFLYSQL